MEEHIYRLRHHGIAVTPQRLAVLATLEGCRDHPSAERIYREVRRQLPAISFNTVYKTLETFCEKGLALKVNPLHEAARYDGDTSHHAHLICRRCHTIIDLPWEAPPAPVLAGEDLKGFHVEQQTLTIWGLCPRCQGCKAQES
jgi:Fur family peroxide stress response transcriptional regulator